MKFPGAIALLAYLLAHGHGSAQAATAVTPNRVLELDGHESYIGFGRNGPVLGNNVITPGSWSHVALTGDGATQRPYVNGRLGIAQLAHGAPGLILLDLMMPA
jgi:hypothetical protein